MYPDFWTRSEHQLDMIEAAKPSTAADIITLLDGHHGAAHFDDAIGDKRSLLTSLTSTGWEITRYHAWYHWALTHHTSGDRLEYIEGDIYDRTTH